MNRASVLLLALLISTFACAPSNNESAKPQPALDPESRAQMLGFRHAALSTALGTTQAAGVPASPIRGQQIDPYTTAKAYAQLLKAQCAIRYNGPTDNMGPGGTLSYEITGGNCPVSAVGESVWSFSSQQVFMRSSSKFMANETWSGDIRGAENVTEFKLANGPSGVELVNSGYGVYDTKSQGMIRTRLYSSQASDENSIRLEVGMRVLFEKTNREVKLSNAIIARRGQDKPEFQFLVNDKSVSQAEYEEYAKDFVVPLYSKVGNLL